MTMRKLLLIVMFVVLYAMGVCAQENNVKFSVNVGPQWNTNIGALVGADVLIPLGHSRLGFEPGIYWSYRSTKSNHDNDQTKEEFNDKLHYVNIPLRFAARVAESDDGAFYMSVLIGPYVAYGLSGKSHCTITEDGNVTKSEVDAFGDKGRLDSRFDYGLNFGIDAIVKQHLKISAFSEIGLKKIYKPYNFVEDLLGDIFGVTKINIGAGITVGYQF